MNFPQFLLILRARYKIILLTLVIIVATTAIVSLLLPRTYKATTSLVLNYKGVDPVTGLTLPAQLMPGYMATQVDIINSRRVASQVVDDLRLTEDLNTERDFIKQTGGKGNFQDWIAIKLGKSLEVVPSRESSILHITYRSSDPLYASVVANAFAAAYQQVSLQVKVEPSRRASNFLNDQTKALRQALEEAQNKVSMYQRGHGIVDADDRLDVESARLNDLSSELVQVQAQAMDARSRERQAQSSRNTSPDIQSNPLIQNLKSTLSSAEARFADLSQKLDKNHPQYQAAKSVVEQLRIDLGEQSKAAASSLSGNAHILQQREAGLRSAVSAQKETIMALRSAKDELKVLRNDVASAERAYEAASQRYAQATVAGHSNQSDVAVLSPAAVPIEVTSPKIGLNIILSFFFGTLLAVGLGMVVELQSRKVRASDDLNDIAGVPFLGGIDWTSTYSGRNRFTHSKYTAALALHSSKGGK